MAKERLYDSLSEEDHDIFGYYADIIVEKLLIHMMHWHRQYGSVHTKRSRRDRHIVLNGLYRLQRSTPLHPVEEKLLKKKAMCGASVERARALREIFNQTLSPHLVGEERVLAERKISSIMSMRSWAVRRMKAAAQKARTISSDTSSHKPRKSRRERLEEFRCTRGPEGGVQEPLPLANTAQTTSETPIATLPNQPLRDERHEHRHSVTLVMPEIDVPASFEQRRVTALGYIPPGYRPKRGKKSRRRYQSVWD